MASCLTNNKVITNTHWSKHSPILIPRSKDSKSSATFNLHGVCRRNTISKYNKGLPKQVSGTNLVVWKYKERKSNVSPLKQTVHLEVAHTWIKRNSHTPKWIQQLSTSNNTYSVISTSQAKSATEPVIGSRMTYKVNWSFPWTYIWISTIVDTL